MKIALSLLVILGVSLLGSAAPAAQTARVIHFNGGEAVVTTANGLEHVVIKDASGVVGSDSYCDATSGTYDQILAFGAAVVAAAKRDDRRAIANLMQYPLRVNRASGALDVKSSSALLAGYREILSAKFVDRLAQIEPHDVFCKNGMSMLGNGIIWASPNRQGALKGTILNP